LVFPTLELAAAQPGGFIRTAELIEALTKWFEPQGVDANILEGCNDTYFSQKVRNMISHRHSSGSFIAQGYAEYVRHGIRVTDAGRTLLKRQAA
jgi:hypothetical protein